jgi:hypothetical protein
MTSFAVQAHEVARSRDVFMDPQTYRGFDLTEDRRRMVGCIDPRDEEQEALAVIMQTAGGAAGKGFDAGLALTAASRSRNGHIHSIQGGLQYDSDLQRATVPGAHDNCRFVMGMAAVADEIIHPSDFTQDTLRSLISRYELKETGIVKDLGRIGAAADRMRDHFAETAADPEGLLADVSALYPQHQNVTSMRGNNTALFYILNHHPFVGLDRSLVHRGDRPLVATAYHDSVRATIESLQGTVGMPRRIKDLRLAALLSRVAATRTVLCADTPRMQYLHVVPTHRGIQVEQEHI